MEDSRMDFIPAMKNRLDMEKAHLDSIEEENFSCLHRKADRKPLEEKCKQSHIVDKLDIAGGNNVSHKLEDRLECHNFSCCSCDKEELTRTLNAGSSLKADTASETLCLNADGDCACFQQPPDISYRIQRQVEDSRCSNTTSSDLSQDLCDGYGCDSCKRERIKQWRQMGRALRQLLDRGLHSLSRNSTCTQTEYSSRCHRRGDVHTDCSGQTNSLAECASPNECQCRSLTTLSSSSQTERTTTPLSPVHSHGRQHIQLEKNSDQISCNVIKPNAVAYSSPSHVCNYNNRSGTNYVSRTESSSKSCANCISSGSSDQGRNHEIHDYCNPSYGFVTESAYCVCGNEAGTDDTGLGSMLRNTDDSDSAASDDSVPTLFPVSVAGKLVFLSGGTTKPDCSCTTKSVAGSPKVNSDIHNSTCHISSEENFMVSSEGTWVKTSASLPSPESTITDTSSVVDLLEASCDYIPHFKDAKDQNEERKMRPTRRLYKRLFRVPDGRESSVSSEDNCQLSVKPEKTSYRKDQYRSLKQRAPVVSLPNGYSATLCQFSSSEEYLDQVQRPKLPLEVKQKKAAEKKSQFSSFLSGLRSAIPYLPQRLRASLQVAQSDSSPDTVDPNSSFSWERSSTSETEASIVEEEGNSSSQVGQNSAMNCMSDILSELKEIRRDLDDACNCVDDADKLSSSNEEGTESSDECHLPSSSDSGEADDEFECECDSCQLLQQQRADHRVVDQVQTEPEQTPAEEAAQGSGMLWLPHTDEEEGRFQISVAELSPLESLMSDRRGMLDLMFENVIIQMLAVHPDLLNDQAPPPASDALIDGLPSILLTQEHIDQSPCCPVCLCPCTVGEIVTKLPCHHLFHPLCIRAWLVKSGTCPVCRHALGT